jgi:predicted porin
MRDTFVGLGGGFGTVLLGKHDTPLKMVGRQFDQFGDRIGDLRNLTSGNGDAVKMGWDLRPSNVIAYVSPAFGGFTGILAYVANETTNTGVGTYNGSNASADKADAYSASLTGSIGKFGLGLAYENHANAFSGIDKSMSAYRLGASYDFGMVKVTGLYANQDTVAAGAIKARSIYALGAGIKVGAAGTVKAQYAMADKLSGVADSGASMYTIGYDHAMSKNTTAYVAYSLTDNQSAANFNTAAGGHGEYMTVVQDANGAYKDPSAFSVGIIHKF